MEPDLTILDAPYDFREAEKWYSNTLLRHKPSNSFVICLSVNIGKQGYVLSITRDNVQAEIVNLSEICSKAPTLGLFDYEGGVYRVQRATARQYSKGFPYRNLVVSEVSATGKDNGLSLSPRVCLSESFQNMLKNQYPNTVEELKRKFEKEKAFSLSRKLWVKVDTNFGVSKVYYENTGVMLITKEGKSWFTENPSSLMEFLKEKYSNLLTTVSEAYRD